MQIFWKDACDMYMICIIKIHFVWYGMVPLFMHCKFFSKVYKMIKDQLIIIPN